MFLKLNLIWWVDRFPVSCEGAYLSAYLSLSGQYLFQETKDIKRYFILLRKLSFESTGNGQPKPLNAKIHLKIHILFSSTHMGSETAKL